jgi:FkbM family methyltransferase
MSLIATKPKKNISWLASYTDFDWLRQQAIDGVSLDYIKKIESDEIAFHEEGIIPTDTSIFKLNLRQGIFYTSRATSHSIASIFVHIFKNRDHLKAGVPRILNSESPVIIDIGANEGFFTSFVAGYAPSARVIAVEPNNIAYKLMQQNINANKLTNVSLVQKAIWSSNGLRMLNVIPEATAISTMAILENSYVNRVLERVVEMPVETVMLSKLMEDFELKRVNLLKIDVEGGELEILESSRSILHLVDYIVLEYHSQDLRKKVTELLTEEGFMLDFHDPDRESFGDIYFKNVQLYQT